MPEVADQNALEADVAPADALLRAETRSFWEALQADSHFILTDTNIPSQTAALDDILAQINDAVGEETHAPFHLVEGWPDMTGFPPSAADVALWREKIEIYHTQYLDLLTDVQAAFPTLVIQPLSLASTLVALLDSSAADRLSAAQLFDANAPEGTALMSALAGLVTQAALSDTPLPESTPEDLPPEITAVYADLAKAAWDMVGGTLTAPDIILPTLPPETDSDVQPDPEPVDTPFLGTSEDDVIVLSEGMARIEAGNGTDTLVVAGLVDDAVIAFGAEGEVLLSVQSVSRAVTLQEVERIAFSDGTLAFDDDGLAGQAYRLYQACFDRTPDAEGLGFWIKQLDAGNVTLNEAAGHFLDSEEFASVYGNPAALADVHYLALLYANVLDRAPDQAGFGFWRDQQTNGVTRADMLVYFSESTENVARVATAIDDGIWYI